MIAEPWDVPDRRSFLLGTAFLAASRDVDRLAMVQLRLARLVLNHFARLNCPYSFELSAIARQASHVDILTTALSTCPTRQRNAESGANLVIDTTRAIRTIRTSGSSGVPLSYAISAAWRRAHHVTWRLAYSIMTEGRVSGYLDRRWTWAMARPPAGSRDVAPNTVDIFPDGGAIRTSCPPQDVSPHVIHGSCSTIIDALANPAVASWRPDIVVLTYEKASAAQLSMIADAWPRAVVHIEYAANDGGLSAFTCPNRRLHAWTMRSLLVSREGRACVIDLFNGASSFVAYENGDEVRFLDERCSCGLSLPVIDVCGRRADVIRLSGGRSISALCPFSSEELRGVRGVRVEILDDQHCRLVLIRASSGVDLVGLSRRLASYGLSVVEVTHVASVAALCDRAKFRTVVDRRERTSGDDHVEN
jgi:hypothetical protein